jgi:N6-L-threonylcarbamoyladenine synthase
MLTLGIETSCDETSIAVTDSRRVLSNRVTSSVHLHSRFGGVVPEIASRHHVEYINYVLEAALKDARVSLKEIRLIAVTRGPGLIGALLTGVSMAKALSYSLGVPLIGVNHVLAHIHSIFLNDGAKPKFPFIGLVVSGGHTSLYVCRDFGRVKLLGQTQDDALGEAYDKVAKILGLGFPGGPVIEKAALLSEGKSDIRFPRAFLEDDSLDFSFSGIKTAVLYYVRDLGGRTRPGRLTDKVTNDICRAFQDAALDVVIEKTLLACRKTKLSRLVVGGGVSANKALRANLAAQASAGGIQVYFPPFSFCTDNGAMVALLGEELYKRGVRSTLRMTAAAEPKV